MKFPIKGANNVYGSRTKMIELLDDTRIGHIIQNTILVAWISLAYCESFLLKDASGFWEYALPIATIILGLLTVFAMIAAYECVEDARENVGWYGQLMLGLWFRAVIVFCSWLSVLRGMDWESVAWVGLAFATIALIGMTGAAVIGWCDAVERFEKKNRKSQVEKTNFDWSAAIEDFRT